MSAADDFFVGYLDAHPAGLTRPVRRRVLLLLLAAAVVGALSAASQRTLPPVTFEYGQPRAYEGWLTTMPYQALWFEGEDALPAAPTQRRFALVAEFKFGADALVAGFDGQRVTLTGTLVRRDDQTMLEVVAGSVSPVGGDAAWTPPAPVDRGLQTFEGEIVDSKCFLGVMNPGHLKPHRACAVRCISGGIPPVLVVRDAAGVRYLTLTDTDGGPVNGRVLDMIAEPLRITGRVVQHGELTVLEADPATYERLP